jgi:DNA-binding transcriptional LysR family regulator
MAFRSFDSLKIFDVVSRHMSFTAAAEELHVTKSAVSYQIKSLENQLGFKVFLRTPGNLTLTEKGLKLWHISEAALKPLEDNINRMTNNRDTKITVGLTTYFASRWLSSRLMNFTSQHPEIGLRLQPTMGVKKIGDGDLDIAVRWGDGNWNDCVVEPLLPCPAFPTASGLLEQSPHTGLTELLSATPLLHDDKNSLAWEQWHQMAGIPYIEHSQGLVIPDPNVRVQAVIDGQGLALNDNLVDGEIRSGRLKRISTIVLEDYGYFLCYKENSLDNPSLLLFKDWILEEATADI